MLTETQINVNDKPVKKSIPNEIITTKPNKKFLGIPFGMYLYKTAKTKPDSVFGQWMKRKKNRAKRLNGLLSPKQVDALKNYYINFNKWIQNTGEAPAIPTVEAITKSTDRLKKYYKNQGYFDVEVQVDSFILPKKKWKLTYNIETKNQYVIDSITANIQSKDIDSLYATAQSDSYIRIGEPFEVGLFQQERERLINFFLNQGIYNFQQSSLSFTAAIDSTGKDLKIPVSLNIGNYQKRVNDTLREFVYKVHRIDDVSIYVESTDDLEQVSAYTDSIDYGGYRIYSKGKLKYKPRALTSGMFIKNQDVFREKDRAATYRYFSNLRNFKYPSILYTPSKTEDGALSAALLLTPKERFSLGFDLDLSHSNIQDFGIGLSGILGIRNAFKETDQLSLSLKNNIGNTSNVLTGNQNDFFNIFELGADIALTIPKIFSPFNTSNFIGKEMFPQTQIVIGARFQQNIGLDKVLYTGKYELDWEPRKNKKIAFKLLDFEYVNNRSIENYFNVYRNSYDRLNAIAQQYPENLEPEWLENSNLKVPTGTDAFINAVLQNETQINATDPPYRVVNSIRERRERLTANNLIMGSSLSMNINNQENILDENFYQLRAKVDWVGNLLNGFLVWTRADKNDLEQYLIDGVIPSQYIRGELDFIKHWSLGNNRIIALRTFAGVAIPFGNARNIPFSRSFFAGGTNDNRAWRAYRLGPGSSNNINEFNEANLKFGLNLEYRTPLLGKLNGALFVDIGNIWNVMDAVDDPKMRFDGFRDLDELAIGSGFGLRYDFDFIVFRFDIGFKSYNPARPSKSRWWTDHTLSRAVYNIGINYPF